VSRPLFRGRALAWLSEPKDAGAPLTVAASSWRTWAAFVVVLGLAVLVLALDTVPAGEARVSPLRLLLERSPW
jgi:hypothetical protein